MDIESVISNERDLLDELVVKYRVNESGIICYRYGPQAGWPVSDKKLAIDLLEAGVPISNLLVRVGALIKIIKEGKK